MKTRWVLKRHTSKARVKRCVFSILRKKCKSWRMAVSQFAHCLWKRKFGKFGSAGWGRWKLWSNHIRGVPCGVNLALSCLNAFRPSSSAFFCSWRRKAMSAGKGACLSLQSNRMWCLRKVFLFSFWDEPNREESHLCDSCTILPLIFSFKKMVQLFSSVKEHLGEGQPFLFSVHPSHQPASLTYLFPINGSLLRQLQDCQFHQGPA